MGRKVPKGPCPVCRRLVATNKDPEPDKVEYPGSYRVMRRHGVPECKGAGMRILSSRTHTEGVPTR